MPTTKGPRWVVSQDRVQLWNGDVKFYDVPNPCRFDLPDRPLLPEEAEGGPDVFLPACKGSTSLSYTL
jgi:hypothetical protein